MQILAYVAPPTTGRDGHRSRMRGEGGGGLGNRNRGGTGNKLTYQYDPLPSVHKPMYRCLLVLLGGVTHKSATRGR